MLGTVDITKAIDNVTFSRDAVQTAMMASMLGIGAASIASFIDALRDRKWHQYKPKPPHLPRKASALEELFKDRDMVALSSAELWHTLRLLNSYLPVRINPDLIRLKELFDVNNGGSM